MDTGGLGGSEEAVVRVAEALAEMRYTAAGVHATA
jgi:hypothetical protein